MRLEVKLFNDEDEVVAEHTSDAVQPSQWRTPSGQKLIAGNYEFFGFTIQPHVRVLYPKGYAKAPSPENGLPTNSSTSLGA